MKNSFKFFLLLSLLLTSLWGCKEEEVIPNPPPVPKNGLEANAGTDLQVMVNTEVTLDGKASKDADEKPFSFLWFFKSKPTGSNVSLSNSTTSTPSFTPDVAGTYVLELKISRDSFKDQDEVSIVATAETNIPPTAGTISENIERDTTLVDIFPDLSTPDYIVTTNVQVKAKMNLHPGVVIAFEADKGLHIFPQGALVAKGQPQNPIIFRGKEQIKGYWKGILFDSNNSLNALNYAVVEQGGSSSFPEIPGVKANVALTGNTAPGASLSISYSFLQESGGFGMYLQEKAELKNFANNFFSQNEGSALYVPAREVYKLDAASSFTGSNGFEGIETGGEINESIQHTWPSFADGSEYLVSSNLQINSGLRIAEGAVLKMAPEVLISVNGNGYLTSNGTPGKANVFTAHSQTTDNYWAGILFNSKHLLNKLQYTEISFAGSSDIPGLSATRANIAIESGGSAFIQNSVIKNGLGWGIILEQGAEINQDFLAVNSFSDLALGSVYPSQTNEPEPPSLTGEWVDSWSYANEHFTIDEQYYNLTSGIWFRGANHPWEINPQTGFGLKIRADGSYTWTIADRHSFNPECFSYSAEFIEGQLSFTGNHNLLFLQSNWRSRYYNSCENENVDFDVDPANVTLRHEIFLETLSNGQKRWVLKLINPDNSSFFYYRKAELPE